MSVGERIQTLRKQAKLSQGQLAAAVSVSRQAVSKWETGKALPDSMKMILLAQVLDTDIEFLSTGRRSSAPVVINSVETVEKIVEKPVIHVVEKLVERPVVEYIEKPVVKKVYRKEYVRNPVEYILVGGICFVFGLLIGLLL